MLKITHFRLTSLGVKLTTGRLTARNNFLNRAFGLSQLMTSISIFTPFNSKPQKSNIFCCYNNYLGKSLSVEIMTRQYSTVLNKYCAINEDKN